MAWLAWAWRSQWGETGASMPARAAARFTVPSTARSVSLARPLLMANTGSWMPASQRREARLIDARSRLADLQEAKRQSSAERQAELAQVRLAILEGIDVSLQATPLWRTLKREFPDWYAKRLKEAAGLAAQNQDDTRGVQP
jgi:hypothetical protein